MNYPFLFVLLIMILFWVIFFTHALTFFFGGHP